MRVEWGPAAFLPLTYCRGVLIFLDSQGPAHGGEAGGCLLAWPESLWLSASETAASQSYPTLGKSQKEM